MRAPHPWLGHPELQKKNRLDFLGPIFFLIAWFGVLCTLAATQLGLKSSLVSIRRSKLVRHRSLAITGFAHRGHQRNSLSTGATATSAMSVTVTGGGTLCAVVRADSSSGQEAPISPTMTGLSGTWVSRGTTHQWPGSSCKAYLFTCTNYVGGSGTITVNFPALAAATTIDVVVDEILGGKTVVQTKMGDYGGASGGVSAITLDAAPNSNSFVWGYFAVGLNGTYSPRVRPGFNTVGLFDSVNFPSHGLPGMLTAYELGTNTLDFDLGGSSSSYRNVGAVEIAA